MMEAEKKRNSRRRRASAENEPAVETSSTSLIASIYARRYAESVAGPAGGADETASRPKRRKTDGKQR